jgi:hypothetical protein
MIRGQRFRKKPVEVEAMQFDGSPESADIIQEWASQEPIEVRSSTIIYQPEAQLLQIPTLEGNMTASPGDWVIRGVQREFYPCKPDIFEETYEGVDS